MAAILAILPEGVLPPFCIAFPCFRPSQSLAVVQTPTTLPMAVASRLVVDNCVLLDRVAQKIPSCQACPKDAGFLHWWKTNRLQMDQSLSLCLDGSIVSWNVQWIRYQ